MGVHMAETKSNEAISIEQMKRNFAEKKRKQLREAIRQLEDLEQMSFVIGHCVHDCNGESCNGWKPDLQEADRLISLMYWKTVRVHDLLEGRDTDGTEIEIALFERS
jgi:hypothetical protein